MAQLYRDGKTYLYVKKRILTERKLAIKIARIWSISYVKEN